MEIKNLKSYWSLKFTFVVLNDIALLICGFLFEKNVLTYLVATTVCLLLTIVIPEGKRWKLKLNASYLPALQPDKLDWMIRILLWAMVASVFVAFSSSPAVPDTLLFSSVLIALFTGSEIPYYRYARALCKGDSSLIPVYSPDNSCEMMKQYVSFKILTVASLGVVFLASGMVLGSKPFTCYMVSGICFLVGFLLIENRRRKLTVKRSPTQNIMITMVEFIVCQLFSALAVVLLPVKFSSITQFNSVAASLFCLFYLLTQVLTYFYVRQLDRRQSNSDVRIG